MTVCWEDTSLLFQTIRKCAYGALLEEVYTTPKPGLVDLHDTGAHRDMDVRIFEKSAWTLSPYFSDMAKAGYLEPDTPERIFRVIRRIGVAAEKAMFQITGGINTHKGAVFTIGILSAAAGYVFRSRGDFPAFCILQTAKEMTSGEIEIEFSTMKNRAPATHGEWLYQTYGEKGIRGEAQAGFPIIRRYAYPAMRSCYAANADRNLTNLNILLCIMSELHDTNVLYRGGYDDLRWLKKTASEILRVGGAFSVTGYEKLAEMNKECIRRNISPGGAADLLAATVFLGRLEEVGYGFNL